MPSNPPLVLIVDHESEATRALVAFLRAHELDVVWAPDAEGAFHAIDEERVDGLVTELRAPRIDGIALLRRARQRNPDVSVVIVTTAPDASTTAEALREGAADVQGKPLHLEKVMSVLRRGFAHQGLAARVAELEAKLDERFELSQLGGHSRAISRVMEQIRHLGSTRATVLIEGEAGTGKGLVAQAIHQNSPRKHERFVWVNCGALAESLVEGELFGSESGGATRPGRFELAEQGTLFLDEVSEISSAAQVRLLRVLQDRELERVGGQQAVRVDVRLIVATRRDLAAEIQAGRFREDLFSRLSVVRIAMPSLEERREDIPVLVEAFLREFNRGHGRKITGVTRGVLERLMRHHWPGNLRELRNTLEGMVVFAEGRRPLDLSDLPPGLSDVESEGDPLRITVGMTVEEAERLLITATLRQADFDKPRAAAMLGIGLRTLYRKIKEYGIR